MHYLFKIFPANPMGNAGVAERMLVLLLNERGAGTILKYDGETLSRVLFLLETQQRLLDSEKDLPNAVSCVYRTEAERLRWIASEYLKTRLEKIRGNFYIKEEGLFENLSPEEAVFYEKYILLNKSHGIYRKREQEAARRGRAGHGGFFVLEDLGEVLVDGRLVEMRRGDFFIGLLDDVIEFAGQGKIVLL